MRWTRVPGAVLSGVIAFTGIAAGRDPAPEATWIVDDFEDQVLDGWTTPSGPCTLSIEPIGADGTAHSLLVNGACGHDGGTTHDLGGTQATGASLYVRSTGILRNHLYVVLDDDDVGANGYIVAFAATSDGRLKALNGSILPFDLTANPGLVWHELQFTIDWVGKNVDLAIDGVPRQYNMPFATTGISSLGRINLYNLEAANAWYDEIELSVPPPSLQIMADGFESIDLTAWTSATPGLPPRLVLFSAGGVSGPIGGRSGADVLCGQAAEGMPGIPLHATTRAFLSVDPVDTIANMPSTFGVPTTRKVTGPNRIVIADRWDDLMDGTVDTSLLDAGVLAFNTWYSGSQPDGSLDSDTCNGWTVGSGPAGRYGFSDSTSSAWISSGDASCGDPSIHILCLAWRTP